MSFIEKARTIFTNRKERARQTSAVEKIDDYFLKAVGNSIDLVLARQRYQSHARRLKDHLLPQGFIQFAICRNNATAPESVEIIPGVISFRTVDDGIDLAGVAIVVDGHNIIQAGNLFSEESAKLAGCLTTAVEEHDSFLRQGCEMVSGDLLANVISSKGMIPYSF
jgi:hypothetical protein